MLATKVTRFDELRFNIKGNMKIKGGEDEKMFQTNTPNMLEAVNYSLSRRIRACALNLVGHIEYSL